MNRIESQGEGFRELAKKVLSWVINTKRTLSTAELQHALAVEPRTRVLNTDFVPDIEIVGSVCAGLVTVDIQSDVVRLVHYTTQEYFERISWFPMAKSDITATCVTYLSFSTFDSGFCWTDKEFEERLQANKLYEYAARNWGHHARAASVEEQLVLDLLESEAKVSCSSQVMIASKRYWDDSGYSQRVPGSITGVHLAAYFGLRDIVITLFRKRHDLDVKDSYGRTPLSWAAENGHEAVVKLLLEKSAELESKDHHGWTPLLWAARNGQEAVVKLLLKRGAKLESKDSCGWTLLSWTAINGREAVVKLLLEKGAELESKDSISQTPLLWGTRR